MCESSDFSLINNCRNFRSCHFCYLNKIKRCIGRAISEMDVASLYLIRYVVVAYSDCFGSKSIRVEVDFCRGPSRASWTQPGLNANPNPKTQIPANIKVPLHG